MKLAGITYVVRDYDEAVRWFVDVLGFALIEDTKLSESKRWVVVGAPGGGSLLVLAKADGEEQTQSVGKAAGGRVGFFLKVNDFAGTHQKLLIRGVRFREAPRRESYGTVVVFDDLYGNGWDLIGPP